jgi:hypothetical protein
MTATLTGRAGEFDFVLEEGSFFGPTLLHLEDGSVDETGTPVPFPEGTVGYMTIRSRYEGPAILELGPADDALAGTITIVDEVITIALPAAQTIDITFPGDVGVHDLIIFPGGDEELAYPLLRGKVFYKRRVTAQPPAPEES